MKSLRRFAVLFTMLLALSGCATTTAVVNDIGAFINGTAVPLTCDIAAYYTNYGQGVVNAVAAFPSVSAAVGPYITMLNTFEATLNAACQSGALTSTINADIANVDNVIQEINSIVGAAKAQGVMK